MIVCEIAFQSSLIEIVMSGWMFVVEPKPSS